MAVEWYYSQEGRRFGPVSAGDFKAMIFQGMIRPDDLVWNKGMTEWQPARDVAGLVPPVPRMPDDGAAAAAGAAGKKLLRGVGKMAERVGQVAMEAVDPDSDSTREPAIFTRSEFCGGRTRIGESIQVLDQLGAQIAAAMFSWLYLVFVLRRTISAWQFVPYSRTELVLITLTQRLRWRKVMPIFISWVVCMIVIMVVSAGLTYVSSQLPTDIQGFFALLAAAVYLGGYVLANLYACRLLLGLSSIHRTAIVVEYGYPKKRRLLYGLSDAGIEQQMDAVLQLCQAIAQAQFGNWDQHSRHNSGGACWGRCLGGFREKTDCLLSLP